MLLTISIQNKWQLYHMDVKTIFFYSDFKKKVYITEPQHFVFEGHEHLVCKLHKAFYGLKLVPKAWYDKINFFLQTRGLIKGEGDYNLYIINYQGKMLLLVFYIDDLLFTKNYIK